MIAEFYIRLVEKVDPKVDPFTHRGTFHAGDVIEVRPEGWVWGLNEISSPDHIIVKVEVESIDKASMDYMSGELYDQINNPNPAVRSITIDYKSFPKLVLDKVLAKDPIAIKSEYLSRKAQGKSLVMGDTSDSVYKIPSLVGFDITTVKTVKVIPKNQFVAGDSQFKHAP